MTWRPWGKKVGLDSREHVLAAVGYGTHVDFYCFAVGIFNCWIIALDPYVLDELCLGMLA